MKRNLAIRASAGTGKTFALATRFLRLMLFQDARPERIVAITFSRAAAREILFSLLSRLVAAASSAGGAARERGRLLAGLSPADLAALAEKGTDFSPASFTVLLRRVLDGLSAGTISTLDSFILRIVRAFPLETGFQTAIGVLDGFGGEKAVRDAEAAVLSDAAAAEEVRGECILAAGGAFERSGSAAFDAAVSGWRAFRLACRGACDAWTPESMLRAAGLDPDAAPPAGAEELAGAVSGNGADLFAKFAAQLASHRPGEEVFKDNNPGRMAAFLAGHPEETAYRYRTAGGREKVCECGAAGAAFVRAGVRWMLAGRWKKAMERACASIALARRLEEAYDAATRRRGRLAFADFPDAVAGMEAAGGPDLENLQFRFDAAFDHWALDEFQDTSARQWECLRPLVRAAAQEGGGRTVMAVGDLKQSIYGWRGGNDAPFLDLTGWAEFAPPAGEIAESGVSRRYGRNTAAFVNRVFGPENIRGGGLFPPVCAPAVGRWLSETCWMEHRADESRPDAGEDSVVVYAVPRPDGDAADAADADAADEGDGTAGAMRILAPAVCRFVADLWKERARAGSAETVGILVRDNRGGLALAEKLRSMPDAPPVVWEGMDGLLDSPAVRAVLELLKLAEKPEDNRSWRLAETLFPVRALVFPELKHREKVSSAVAESLARRGLARTVAEIAGKILSAPEGMLPDARGQVRLKALVRESVAWEARAGAAEGMAAFEEYLASSAGRETASSPHAVRILTIHRAKGLTFDHVVVPVPEAGGGDSIARPKAGRTRLADVAAGWAMAAPKEAEAMAVEAVRKAWEAAANERALDDLRVYYVALTRARKSTCVFTVEDDHAVLQFRDILVRPFASGADGGGESGPYGRVVCRLGGPVSFAASRPEERGEAAPAAWEHAAGGPRLARRSPSEEPEEGRGAKRAAAALFARGKTAAELGTELHARYARIGWIDPAAPADGEEAAILSSPWREAFVEPAGGGTLWREMRYERVADGAWETGRFDRVVFSGAGEGRRAAVYDFKGARPRDGEGEEAFAERMRAAYAGQMRSYRAAVAALAGLEESRVRAVLLLAAGHGAVETGSD